jgi:hypothetical protein
MELRIKQLSVKIDVNTQQIKQLKTDTLNLYTQRQALEQKLGYYNWCKANNVDESIVIAAGIDSITDDDCYITFTFKVDEKNYTLKTHSMAPGSYRLNNTDPPIKVKALIDAILKDPFELYNIIN